MITGSKQESQQSSRSHDSFSDPNSRTALGTVQRSISPSSWPIVSIQRLRNAIFPSGGCTNPGVTRLDDDASDHYQYSILSEASSSSVGTSGADDTNSDIDPDDSISSFEVPLDNELSHTLEEVDCLPLSGYRVKLCSPDAMNMLIVGMTEDMIKNLRVSE